MLLGIGGVRAVRAYCRITGHPAPEVFHTNEGHAGFLGLERIRELSHDGLGFDAALEAVRAGTVFTTHTPVPAGIDRFDRDLVARHLGDGGELPGVDVGRILELGLETHRGGDPNLFNMAVMGLRLAQRANGVSTLHGAVSREMFAALWPGFDPDDVPITSITNGVHAPTWVAPEVLRLGGSPSGAERAADARRRRRRPLGGRRRASRTAPSGSCAAPCASSSWTTCAAGCAPPGGSAGRATPNSAGPTRCSTPTSSPSASPAGSRPTSGSP